MLLAADTDAIAILDGPTPSSCEIVVVVILYVDYINSSLADRRFAMVALGRICEKKKLVSLRDLARRETRPRDLGLVSQAWSREKFYCLRQ
jgi:hypothetical protein